ncbi:MAG: radical SAM protein [Myxococcota bacterium]
MTAGSSPSSGDSSQRPSEPVFRDPPPAEIEGDRLALEIAGILVRAPSLPVDLPASGLRLLGVEVPRGSIDLVLGLEAPVAHLRMRRFQGVGSIAVEVEVVRLNPGADRYMKVMQTLADRVARATTAARWKQAAEVAARLRRIPVGVRMEFHRQIVAGVEPRVGLVRLGYLCNQDCGMCWQSRDWGGFGAEQVRTWIEDLYAAGARALLISGGEPSLDAKLPEHLRFARGLGFSTITLETNAIRCSRGDYAQTLREAGLTDAFVSLHSSDPEVSDAITRAPGTHGRTVAGIQRLLAAGVAVKLNAVMTSAGLERLPELPDLIAREFGHRGISGLMLSYPTEPYEKQLLQDMLPEPHQLRSALRETVERAVAVGLELDGLDGPCGPALCAFGADPRVVSLRPIPGPLPRHFRVKLPSCDDCRVADACFGVRPEEHARYGDAVVEPLGTRPTAG